MPPEATKKEETKKLSGSSTTELRVLMTEDSEGHFDIEWQALLKGTEVTIPMRPTHVIGQLITGAFIIAAKTYKGFRDKVNTSG